MNRRSSPTTLTISEPEVSTPSIRRMAAVSMPCAASVSTINCPNGSRPTQPATPVCTPTRVRSMATFAAQPPMASGSRSEITSSPDRGRCEIGAQRWSATKIPALRQSMVKRFSYLKKSLANKSRDAARLRFREFVCARGHPNLS